jgi:hypothetical protein
MVNKKTPHIHANVQQPWYNQRDPNDQVGVERKRKRKRKPQKTRNEEKKSSRTPP